MTKEERDALREECEYSTWSEFSTYRIQELLDALDAAERENDRLRKVLKKAGVALKSIANEKDEIGRYLGPLDRKSVALAAYAEAYADLAQDPAHV